MEGHRGGEEEEGTEAGEREGRGGEEKEGLLYESRRCNGGGRRLRRRGREEKEEEGARHEDAQAEILPAHLSAGVHLPDRFHPTEKTTCKTIDRDI